MDLGAAHIDSLRSSALSSSPPLEGLEVASFLFFVWWRTGAIFTSRVLQTRTRLHGLTTGNVQLS